ncbi:hypothetical protein UlMin_022917 [Ulmus minor]
MGGQYAMDLAHKVCSCRAWDISGIPCSHVVAAIYHERAQPVDYVNQYYKKESMLKAYVHEQVPLPDEKDWPKTGLRPITPPSSKRQPGRPKRIRRRESNEAAPNATKLKRYNIKKFCTKCKQEGHNSRTCDRRKQQAEKEKKGIFSLQFIILPLKNRVEGSSADG